MNQGKFFTKSPVVIICAMLCCALWGSAYAMIKLGYVYSGIDSADTASIILYAGIRFALAGIFAVVIACILNKKIIYPRVNALPKVAILSLFQTIIQYFFFYVGLAHTSGVKASILNGTSVFFSVLISGFVFRMEKVTSKKIIGCLVGLLGIILVNLNSFSLSALGSIFSGFSFNGEAFIIFSAVSYSLSSVLLKIFSKNEDPVMLSGYQFIFGGAVMIIIGLIMGGHIGQFGWQAALILIYLAFLSAVAYSLWGILMKYNDVSRIAVFGFTTQLFGAGLSMLILNEAESLNFASLAALVLVCAGIFIVNYQKKSVID